VSAGTQGRGISTDSAHLFLEARGPAGRGTRRFFFPYIWDDADAETMYQALRSATTRRTGRSVTERRVLRLQYVETGRAFTSIVGRPDDRTDETVLAIFEVLDRSAYLVCTRTHGVGDRHPIAVDAGAILEVEDFECTGAPTPIAAGTP
jgi:hypothetical protein